MIELTEQELAKERAIARNEALWRNFDVALLAPGLTKYGAMLDQLSKQTIYQHINLMDYDFEVEVEIRNRMYELELQGVETDQTVAQIRYKGRIDALALKTAGEQLVLDAREYYTTIESLIMSAKEFAAGVERQELLLEKDRAIMAVDKEKAHARELGARKLIEIFDQKSVQVDIAKAKLQVAQENVKVIMAQIAAQEANVKAVEYEVQYAMTEVEKATLIADVAQILAEIVVKGLIKIKLDVERQDIAASWRIIQSFFDDTLALWGLREQTMAFRADQEALLSLVIQTLLEAEQRQVDLQLVSVAADQFIWDTEKTKMELIRVAEEGMRNAAFASKEQYESIRSRFKISMLLKEEWAAMLVGAARRWAVQNMQLISNRDTFNSKIIHSGVVSMPTASFGDTGASCQ